MPYLLEIVLNTTETQENIDAMLALLVFNSNDCITFREINMPISLIKMKKNQNIKNADVLSYFCYFDIYVCMCL